MTVYHLLSHVQACFSNGQIILLDPKRDNYFTLSHDESEILAPLVKVRSISVSAGESDLNKMAILKELKSAGLITTQLSGLPLFGLRKLNRALFDCSNAHFLTCYPVTIWQILLFVHAFILAIIETKILGIYRTLKRHSKQATARIALQNSPPRENLQSIMHAFQQIRVFFYTANDHCYFDCAVLNRFLRNCGYDAAWIFGVQAQPFEAHCWIQVDNVVMNNWRLSTDNYTPILSV